MLSIKNMHVSVSSLNYLYYIILHWNSKQTSNKTETLDGSKSLASDSPQATFPWILGVFVMLFFWYFPALRFEVREHTL